MTGEGLSPLSKHLSDGLGGLLTDRGRRAPGSGDSGVWRRGAWLMQSGWMGGQREKGRRRSQDHAGRVWDGGHHARKSLEIFTRRSESIWSVP